MITRPKIKDKYRVAHVPGEGVFLLGERESHVLEGTSVAHVVPLLDGRRTLPQIVDSLAHVVSPTDIAQTMDVLAAAGHLSDTLDGLSAAHGAFWDELGVDPVLAVQALATVRVRIDVLGGTDPEPFVQDLRAFSVACEVGGPYATDHTLRLVLTDDYLRPELADINAEAVASGRPYLLVKPVGVRVWVGPLVVPRRTPCWACLATVLRSNREVESFVVRKTTDPAAYLTSRAQFRLGERQASSISVVQLVRALTTGDSSALESQIHVIDNAEFAMSSHQVTRRPDCAVCGTGRRDPHTITPVVLQPARGIDAGAGIRREPPEITYERYAHLVSPVTGVVSQLRPALGHGFGPLYSYVAGHNFALKNDQLYFLKDGLRTFSSGKGRTPAQARTSALCEALERYSGVFQNNEPRRRGTLEQLAGAGALDPRSIMQFSDQQYDDRDAWLARGSRFQVVPRRFDPAAAMEWSPVWSMTADQPRLLPTSYMYYNYPDDPAQFFCWADSNGAAAGTTLEDAILQGLFELYERDAVAVWWYNRLSCPAVDLDSVADGFITAMQDFYASLGRTLTVLDVTTDLGVPVFVALSARTSGPTEDIMMGFGAHLDPATALNRALTELNQFIPAVLDVQPDGTTRYGLGDLDAIRWWSTATRAEHTYLEPDGPARPLAAAGPEPLVDAAAVVTGRIEDLRGRGFEVLVLDQTRPETGLPVAKVMVPGLRHFWARFAPGRLYDAPVTMGKLTEALTEDQLNPIPMFL